MNFISKKKVKGEFYQVKSRYYPYPDPSLFLKVSSWIQIPGQLHSYRIRNPAPDIQVQYDLHMDPAPTMIHNSILLLYKDNPVRLILWHKTTYYLSLCSRYIFAWERKQYYLKALSFIHFTFLSLTFPSSLPWIMISIINRLILRLL